MMRDQMVSILLPFRNAAATLDAAIASIAAQTFQDWDLLLIDNASTEEGPPIARMCVTVTHAFAWSISRRSASRTP